MIMLLIIKTIMIVLSGGNFWWKKFRFCSFKLNRESHPTNQQISTCRICLYSGLAVKVYLQIYLISSLITTNFFYVTPYIMYIHHVVDTISSFLLAWTPTHHKQLLYICLYTLLYLPALANSSRVKYYEILNAQYLHQHTPNTDTNILNIKLILPAVNTCNYTYV